MRTPTRLALLLPSLALLAVLLRCAHPSGPAPASGPAPVVTTDRGPVRGLAYADGSAAFLGIPFAAAPTGALRWRPPAPHAPWTEPRDATRYGSTCPQVDMFSGKTVEASEDCLSLNVWTPAIKPATPAPVMVFIHGGGFTLGSSSMELYSGEGLAHAGVVMVSMNYRLGALGFLAHPALSAEDPHQSSGDYGLMDQRRALEWVRDNAAAFGGDPANVTIFGESAGAISVCFQLLSPQARGLFHRAIEESGSCAFENLPLHDPNTPAKEDSAEERGARFAQELGCTGADVPACLRAKTPAELLGASGAALDLLRPHVGFGPNVDGEVVPAQARQLLKDGKFAQVPLLLGTNADEGSLFTMRAKLDTAEQYAEAVRVRAPKYAEELLRLYPAKDFTSPHEAFNHLLRDSLFLCPSRTLARAVAERGQPVYAYQFTYEPKSFFSLFTKLGSFHAAELPFVFGAEKGRFTLGSDKERELSVKMIGYWTRFATGSNPNGGAAADWPAYTRDGEPHLVFNTTLDRGAHLDQAHCDALEALGL